MYTKAILLLNHVGLKLKRHYFERYRDHVLEQMHLETKQLKALRRYQPSKAQMKSVARIAQL